MYEVKSYTLGRMLGIPFGTVAFCGFKLSTTAVAPERNTHMGVVNPVAELPGFDGVLGICLPCGLVFVNLRLQDEQHIFFIMATWHGTGSGWVGGGIRPPWLASLPRNLLGVSDLFYGVNSLKFEQTALPKDPCLQKRQDLEQRSKQMIERCLDGTVGVALFLKPPFLPRNLAFSNYVSVVYRRSYF